MLACLLPALVLVAAPQEPAPRTWTVDGQERSALVAIPATARHEPTPLVFAFHGHGGTAANAARTFRLHEQWPAAVVVYPQGLPTATGRDPDGERAGWQNQAATQGDRDLHFVDTMLASLRSELRIDPNHIHATGHSNGGGFTYLLWALRGDVLASVAPSAAGAAGAAAARDGGPPPVPVLHLAGRRDPVVRFANQQRTIEALRRAQQTGPGEPWPAVPGVTRYPAANGGDIATLIHAGTHQFPAAGPAAIAAFFQATPRPSPWVTPPTTAPGLVQHRYPSPTVGTVVSYHVWLPPGYGDEPERRYPVLFWLHGSGGGEAGIAPLVARCERAVAAGQLPACLVVFPNGLPLGMWCDAHDGSTPVASWVLDELLPRIDRQFRTRAERDGRAVAGFSMGGYGALRFGLLRPEQFAVVASLGGGPLQPELVEAPRVDEARRVAVLERVYGTMERFQDASPWRLAERLVAAAPRLPRLWLACGGRDETLPANQGLHEHLTRLGLDHRFVTVPDVPHDPQRLLAMVGDELFAELATAWRGVSGAR